MATLSVRGDGRQRAEKWLSDGSLRLLLLLDTRAGELPLALLPLAVLPLVLLPLALLSPVLVLPLALLPLVLLPLVLLATTTVTTTVLQRPGDRSKATRQHQPRLVNPRGELL